MSLSPAPNYTLMATALATAVRDPVASLEDSILAISSSLALAFERGRMAGINDVQAALKE